MAFIDAHGQHVDAVPALEDSLGAISDGASGLQNLLPGTLGVSAVGKGTLDHSFGHFWGMGYEEGYREAMNSLVIMNLVAELRVIIHNTPGDFWVKAALFAYDAGCQPPTTGDVGDTPPGDTPQAGTSFWKTAKAEAILLANETRMVGDTPPIAAALDELASLRGPHAD